MPAPTAATRAIVTIANCSTEVLDVAPLSAMRQTYDQWRHVAILL
jgi:hypothetical protein